MHYFEIMVYKFTHVNFVYVVEQVQNNDPNYKFKVAPYDLSLQGPGFKSVHWT